MRYTYVTHPTDQEVCTVSTYHATKYDSARDEVVALLSDPTEGFGSEYFGNVDAPTGYVQVVRLTDDLLETWEQRGVVDSWEDRIDDLISEHHVTSDDVRGLHAVVSNDQGFVTVLTFASEDLLASWLRETEEEFAAWDDQD